eukprot:TRINITY_DN375_c0_g1_i1.p2 TRINITY_DN375_c0_g1~~TRINITY_DN375_c0_g1_i1.p2  ORF type:complete len:171 (+),score=35.89 TRINITY_DN375_c0_g1_i1:51-515(+)
MLPLLGMLGLALGCAQQTDMSTCWDAGYFDWYDVPKCEAECAKTPNCNTWAVTTGGVQRCHLCSKQAYFTPAATWTAGCSMSTCGIQADKSTCWDAGFFDSATRESCRAACAANGGCRTWALMTRAGTRASSTTPPVRAAAQHVRRTAGAGRGR